MKINMIKRLISVLLPAAFLAAGCTEMEAPVQPEIETPQSVLATKCLNTVERASDGTLLLYLEEDAALKIAAGETVPEWDQVCAEYGIERVEKLFPDTDNELARRYGLHRWFMVSFSEDDSVERVAEVMAKLNSVTGIQFNTEYERKFGSEAPIPWKPFQGRGYGEFNLPFNDPMLVDQWHYINNKDMSVAETSRTGADINVKNAWGLTAGDPRIIVAVCDEGVKYTHPDLAANMWVNEAEIPDNGIDDDKNGYIDDIHGWNFLPTIHLILKFLSKI